MSLKPYPSPATSTSIWTRLATVPHRAFFSAGVLAALALAGWWAYALSHPGNSQYPAMLVHALLTPLGIFPLFILGFIYTAGPRWLGVAGPERVWPIALIYLVGLALALFGFARPHGWPGPGLLLMLGSWLVAAWRWQKCILQSQAQDRVHARALWLAMQMGSGALLLTLLWSLNNDLRPALLARHIALWGFLLPVFLTVCHRMLPFFTQAVLPQRTSWRPYSLLYRWLAGCALLAFCAASGWPLMQAILAGLLALDLAYTSWRWGLWASRVNRLLAMLHLSFAWLPLALALQAANSLGWVSFAAPAHALGLGFCLTMLVGFVTRVSLGHSGRPLQASNTDWAIYLGMHGLALIRLGLALGLLPLSWLLPSAVALLTLLTAWALRMLPMYWRENVPA